MNNRLHLELVVQGHGNVPLRVGPTQSTIESLSRVILLDVRDAAIPPRERTERAESACVLFSTWTLVFHAQLRQTVEFGLDLRLYETHNVAVNIFDELHGCNLWAGLLRRDTTTSHVAGAWGGIRWS